MVRRELVIAFGVIGFICCWVYFGFWPVRLLEEWRARIKTKDLGSVDFRNYQVYDHSVGEPPFITVDFLKGKHFWNPQVAIWLEDLQGKHLETLLVTSATARGLFYAGRSADNFMEFDTLSESNETETRRVD